MNPITNVLTDGKTHYSQFLALSFQKFCEEELLFILPKYQDKMEEGACFSFPARNMERQVAESHQTEPGDQLVDSELLGDVPALAPLNLVYLHK